MNEEEKETTKEQDAAQALILNTEEISESKPAENISSEKIKIAVKEEKSEDEHKVFRKYKIKDIVFLAIMAACMLVTGSIMPLIGSIPVFALIQVCLGLQFSIFPTIGMMKVRKPGALIFMSLCCGVLFAFFFLPMFVCIMICAVVAEALTLIIFRGYKRDGACLFAGTIYFPVTLPCMYIYYNFIYTVGDNTMFIASNAWVAIGMSAAVIAICFVGAILGVVIARELKKAGVLKK